MMSNLLLIEAAIAVWLTLWVLRDTGRTGVRRGLHRARGRAHAARRRSPSTPVGSQLLS